MAAIGLKFAQALRGIYWTSYTVPFLSRPSPSFSPPCTFSYYRKRFCSSSPESVSSSENPSSDSVRRHEPVSVQPVSYAVKTEGSSNTNEEAAEKPSESPEGLPTPPRRYTVDTSSTISPSWTREDIRYVKNVPSISPISYPTKVAPLPEDRTAATAEVDAPEVVRKAGEQLESETRRIEAGNRIVRQVYQVEEEKVPFPTLIKVETQEKQKTIYDLREAIRQVKANARKKFTETVEAHVRLGLNARRTDMMVRGMMTLPHGTGKTIKVAVFADGDMAEEARAVGADIVGGDALIEEIKNSRTAPEVDLCIATELYMGRLKKISMILRSLMPNPRKGSVTNDVARAVKEAKRGFLEFRMDKTAIVHVGLGKANFSDESLHENIGAFLNALLLAKPAGLKKTSKFAGYVKSFYLCCTMGPGYPISIQSISNAADHFSKMHPH